MKSDELLAWIDIETTGLDHTTEDILEVACIVTDQGLNELASSNWVLFHRCGSPESFCNHNDFVVDMHTKNGLWEASAESDIGLERFESEFTEWLINILNVHPGYHKFVMAGSGVARFDYTWFQYYNFEFMKLFNYYTLDIGVVRRALELAGCIVKKQDEQKVDHLNHRAMDDIEDHLNEGKEYLNYLRRAGSCIPLLESRY